MIVKILTRNSPSYGSLIDYLLKEGKGKDGKPVVITHNFRGTTKEEWVQEFMENEAYRQHVRKDQIYLYHEIISLSSKENKDLITPEIMEDLARQYITLRGKEGMYIASFHEDKDHAHIHFAVSGVKYRTGQAHRLSHDDLYNLKDKFQEYHNDRYPFLSFSSPEHGKGKQHTTNREYFSKTKRTNVKDEIRTKIQSIVAEAKSQQHFLNLLREAGLHHYERGGVPTGVVYDDLKFRFSRLDVPFQEMPVDMGLHKEEQEILDEIQSIREGRRERDQERDIEI